MSSSSSNVPKKGRGGRGGVPPPSIFPKVVYPVGPGSPAGIEPPAANTIPQSFDKQNRKASVKADRYADTKARIVQFLALITIRYVSRPLISLLSYPILIWLIKTTSVVPSDCLTVRPCL